MKIEAVGPLPPVPSRSEISEIPPPPAPSSIERFATLMEVPEPLNASEQINTLTPLNAPSDLLYAQKQLFQMSAGSDWAAKVAGLFTQAVNKLVSLQ